MSQFCFKAVALQADKTLAASRLEWSAFTHLEKQFLATLDWAREQALQNLLSDPVHVQVVYTMKVCDINSGMTMRWTHLCIVHITQFSLEWGDDNMENISASYRVLIFQSTEVPNCFQVTMRWETVYRLQTCNDEFRVSVRWNTPLLCRGRSCMKMRSWQNCSFSLCLSKSFNIIQASLCRTE